MSANGSNRAHPPLKSRPGDDSIYFIGEAGIMVPLFIAVRRLGIFCCTIAVLIALTSGEARGEDRPNILFIMSDDHAFQAISAYGSNRNTTPHIDRIAAEGIRFDRCYVTNSICGPSRATILTGKYSHKNGFYDNLSRFDGSQTTLPKLLQQAGYQTAVIGKWHLVSDPTGFDHWEVLPGQGDYYRPTFITPEGRHNVPGYVTDITTQKALVWLDEKRDPSKPFFLMVHHKAPHRRWDPPVKYLTKFAGEDVAEPPTFMDDYANRGTAAKRAEMRIEQMDAESDLKLWGNEGPTRTWLYNHMTPDERAAWQKHVDPRLAEMEKKNPQSTSELRKAYYQLYIKDYLRCVASVDDSVGTLLEYLDEHGLTKNTIVVYTSDQGFYLGEHGWFDKRFMYEESLRTPLVVRWPGVIEPGRVDDRMVSNLDFAQTFLEAADADAPEGMQGRSLVPLLRGDKPEDWRTSFYYHYYEGVDQVHAAHKHEGVTNGRAKLIHFYPVGEWELYDLEKDPHELMNVYGRPEYAQLQKDLHAELERLRTELEVPPVE
jgi:arylsulfatase A-like enzyme